MNLKTKIKIKRSYYEICLENPIYKSKQENDVGLIFNKKNNIYIF